MARPFNMFFSPDPASCHYCPYTTFGAYINTTGPHLSPRPPNLKTFSPLSLPMQITTFNITIKVDLDKSTNPPPLPHPSSTVMLPLANYAEITWSSFPSPLTPGRGSVPCYKDSSPPPIIPAKKIWCTTPNNTIIYHCPNPNLMYEHASQPPCLLEILMSAILQWI